MKNLLNVICFCLGLLPVFWASHSVAQDMEIIYYHNDTLGSPKAATDEDGDILWRENYAPYGKKLENEEAEKGNHIGYTGKPHERITGFTYLNARYYDPVIGRFMAVDPVEYIDNGSLHFQRYTYAYNNPYKYIDPHGDIAFVAAGPAVVGALETAAAWSGWSGLINTLGALGIMTAFNEAAGDESPLSEEEVNDKLAEIDAASEGESDFQKDIDDPQGAYDSLGPGVNGEKTYPNGTKVKELANGKTVDLHTSRGGTTHEEGTLTLGVKDKNKKKHDKKYRDKKGRKSGSDSTGGTKSGNSSTSGGSKADRANEN